MKKANEAFPGLPRWMVSFAFFVHRSIAVYGIFGRGVS